MYSLNILQVDVFGQNTAKTAEIGGTVAAAGGVVGGLQVLLLGEERFELTRHILDTLQGRIYTAVDKTNNQFCVVKEVWKQLVRLQKARKGGRVPHNFQSEKAIMYYLSNLSIIKL